MRFLAFVTNDAEFERIAQLLDAGGIRFKGEAVRDKDGKAHGYRYSVDDKDFDRADEILSIPGHDFSFNILEKNIARHDLENEYLLRANLIKRKIVRRMAIYIGVGGMAYLLYALVTGR